MLFYWFGLYNSFQMNIHLNVLDHAIAIGLDGSQLAKLAQLYEEKPGYVRSEV